MQCEGIFKIDTRVCEACPNDQIFNKSSSKCAPKPAECNEDEFRDTDGQCKKIVCAEGTKLDLETKTCVSICQENQFYNKTTSACETTPIICEAGKIYNSNTNTCEDIVCKAN